MQQELQYLEQLYLSEKDIKKKYSSGSDLNSPKMGYEKEWEQAQKRTDMLIKIMKLVYREEHALSEQNGLNVASIAEMLLNKSATAHICEVADLIEVKIIDGIKRKIIAEFKVRITLNGTLIFDEYRFY